MFFSSELSEEDIQMLDDCINTCITQSDSMHPTEDDVFSEGEPDDELGDTWSIDTFLDDDMDQGISQDTNGNDVVQDNFYVYDPDDSAIVLNNEEDISQFYVPEIEVLPLASAASVAVSLPTIKTREFNLFSTDSPDPSSKIGCSENDRVKPFICALVRNIQDSINVNEIPILNIRVLQKNMTMYRIKQIRSDRKPELFKCYMFILNQFLENWKNHVTCTKRDIYYRHVGLFRAQARVDDIVDSIAQSLGVGRSDLPIEASMKGLIAGPLKLRLANGSLVDCGSSSTLIPHEHQISDIITSVQHIVIVEKDATFQSLLQHGFTDMFPNAILVTGKGYPDISTRKLVNMLANISSGSPISCHALMDADPDGIGIMLCYRNGSKKHAQDSASLTCPRLVWRGLFLTAIHFAPNWFDYVIYLTSRDRRRVISMLSQSNIRKNALIRRELSLMLHGHVKAELQLISTPELLSILKHILL